MKPLFKVWWQINSRAHINHKAPQQSKTHKQINRFFLVKDNVVTEQSCNLHNTTENKRAAWIKDSFVIPKVCPEMVPEDRLEDSWAQPWTFRRHFRRRRRRSPVWCYIIGKSLQTETQTDVSSVDQVCGSKWRWCDVVGVFNRHQKHLFVCVSGFSVAPVSVGLAAARWPLAVLHSRKLHLPVRPLQTQTQKQPSVHTHIAARLEEERRGCNHSVHHQRLSAFWRFVERETNRKWLRLFNGFYAQFIVDFYAPYIFRVELSLCLDSPVFL